MARTYEDWKDLVSFTCERLCGLSCDDLPDAPYRDWYEENLSPTRAAARAIRNAKEY
jgi:hypothetical protein